MLSLLERGLSFCPTQDEPDMSKYMSDLDLFFRQLRRTEYFGDDSSQEFPELISILNHFTSQEDDSTFHERKFRDSSNFDPPYSTPTLETFCRTVRMQVYKHTSRKPKFHNLTKQERLAHQQLLDNPEIIIKPADKGGCIVIQNTLDYIAECERQLSDTNFYLPQDHDPTEEHNQRVSAKITEMTENQAISPEVADHLVFTKPRTACFYTLPKIHKPTRPPPGRPIVSANECPTERISGFVDHFLRPHVPKIRSYIKDTTDFINKIEAIPPLPLGALLVTLDVTALYTNIPNQDAIRVARDTLNQHRQDGYIHLTNQDLCDLLELVLTCNNFEFNNSH